MNETRQKAIDTGKSVFNDVCFLSYTYVGKKMKRIILTRDTFFVSNPFSKKSKRTKKKDNSN